MSGSAEETLRLVEHYAFAAAMSVTAHQQDDKPLSVQWFAEAETTLQAIRERLPA